MSGYGGLSWTLVQSRKADPGSKALLVLEWGWELLWDGYTCSGITSFLVLFLLKCSFLGNYSNTYSLYLFDEKLSQPFY